MTLLLHNSRVINVTTLLLGFLSGLYGFNSILGKRGGILRQLIVALPAALLFGVAGYLLDVWSNHLYSAIIQEALQPPHGVDPALLVAAETAIVGFLTCLLVPNLGRSKESYQSQSIFAYALYMLALFGLTWLSYATLLLYLGAKGKVPFGLHLSRPEIIIGSAVVAIAYCISNAQYTWRRPVNPANQGNDTPLAFTIVGCVGSLIAFAVGLIIGIPLFALVGWGLLVYFLILFCVGVIVAILQVAADNFPQSRLLYLSLTFFVLAAVLQIYQAIAL
jgi:MFS family permease